MSVHQCGGAPLWRCGSGQGCWCVGEEMSQCEAAPVCLCVSVEVCMVFESPLRTFYWHATVVVPLCCDMNNGTA